MGVAKVHEPYVIVTQTSRATHTKHIQAAQCARYSCSTEAGASSISISRTEPKRAQHKRTNEIEMISGQRWIEIISLVVILRQ